MFVNGPEENLMESYGVLFTYLFLRAVHVETVPGYDAKSFLNALLRFTTVRGWPDTMYSDPGSQIVCVEKELCHCWKSSIYKLSVENGTAWMFRPANSP